MIPHFIHVQACLPNARFLPDRPILVAQISCDSRQVPPGCAFVAIPGTRSDGHQFIGDAIAAGATAVVVEHPQADLAVPQIVVESTRRAWNQLCMAVHGNPHRHLSIAGITGTNGKTTSAWLLRNILTAAGHSAGMIGTVEYNDGRQRLPACLTTPDAEIQAPLMASMLTHGLRHCVMEVSSHAIQQDRCSAVQLAAAAITNITDDHMDYHRTPAAYRAAKARIAGLLHCDAPLLVNGDDMNSRKMLDDTHFTCPVIIFGRQAPSELRYTVLTRTHRSQRLHLELAQGDVTVRVRMIGDHNAANCMVAAGLAEQMGISLPAIASGLEATQEVPGRLERIDEGQPFQVFVDYAHTPDALRNCLTTVREFTHGNLICVFGAGGDRDQVKRPAMAKAAAAADHVFLTSDNPRHESPARIISDILKGFSTRRHVEVETDRKEAIRRALYIAQPGDAVVLTGKGHEKSQVIGARSVDFDDCQVAGRILRELIGLPQVVNADQHGVPVSPGVLTSPV
ncbi:MAG: UDP-N-acetylmuramoyl-L-alanyl-D-glutamate--2,6-diaminopimelate ligase [Fuerstiella sp.]|nr:UDP-N-acetylmuramoyl-L-alanyl-D-glutamate--2,6-diaminopimelate ligase [Fuerstiella sp.]